MLRRWMGNRRRARPDEAAQQAAVALVTVWSILLGACLLVEALSK